LPLRGTKWTDSQEKIEISAGSLRFFTRILLLWLPGQGQYYWQNQNHRMNYAAETNRFIPRHNLPKNGVSICAVGA
jgi:hypothetical protein